MLTKSEFEVEMKSNADEFWGAIKDSANLIPKILPERYKTIEIIEGDGKSVGSVRLAKYAEGVPTVTFSTEKIEMLDDANKMITYRVIDGEMMKLYKTFIKTIKISPKGEGSLVNFTLEYEKASDEAWEFESIKDGAMDIFSRLDAFLLK